jgi:hypothetical protein
MSTIPTTADAIRDRVISVIAGLAPTSIAGTKFRAYRNEGDADFTAWCERNPAQALRRFQVRDTGSDEPPEISNTDTELRTVVLEVLVAYPQNNRTGSRAALDRDDAATEDRRQIEAAIGMIGRANFAPPYPDACWRLEEWDVTRTEGAGIDFVAITVAYQYMLDVSP